MKILALLFGGRGMDKKRNDPVQANQGTSLKAKFVIQAGTPAWQNSTLTSNSLFTVSTKK